MEQIKQITGFFLCIGLLLLFLVYFSWTDSNLDYIFTLLRHHPVNIPLWLSVIISIVGNGITLIFNIIVEIMKHFN